MYSEKLEKLIELTLADGVLTEKEKQVLIKTAEAESVDLDEFEVVLEARLYEKTQQQTGNTVVDKHGKSDAEFENSAGGFKQKSLNFKSSNPLLFKIILYAIIAVVGIFLLKIILSWIASIAIYLIVIAVLGIAIYIGVKIYKIKSEDK